MLSNLNLGTDFVSPNRGFMSSPGHFGRDPKIRLTDGSLMDIKQHEPNCNCSFKTHQKLRMSHVHGISMLPSLPYSRLFEDGISRVVPRCSDHKQRHNGSNGRPYLGLAMGVGRLSSPQV